VKFSHPHIIRTLNDTGLDLGKGFLNWVEHNVHGMLEFSVPDFSCIAAQDKKSSKSDVEKLRISLWEWRGWRWCTIHVHFLGMELQLLEFGPAWASSGVKPPVR
jgi:hypothetical protein